MFIDKLESGTDTIKLDKMGSPPMGDQSPSEAGLFKKWSSGAEIDPDDAERYI